MYVVHGTKKSLARAGAPGSGAPETTARLGNWYATVLFWKPRVALFVKETTLLPMLVPLAPAATVVARFPAGMATALGALGINGPFIERELRAMGSYALAKIANRSVVGTMNEFSYLADAFRASDGHPDLMGLSLRLAQTPCGPLYPRHVSPDR